MTLSRSVRPPRARVAEGPSRGELLITGSAPVRPVDPRAIDVETKAFAVLRNLGFPEGEVRRVLAELRRTRGGEAQNIERVVRDALARLTPTRTP